MNLTNEQIQAILDGAPEGATHCADNQKGYYWECADREHSLEDLREILTLRQEVERLKGHFDKCTGLPASVGICEPVEGYAEEPYFLYSAVKGMAEKIKQLESQQSEVAARAVAESCNQSCSVIANIEQEGVVNSRDGVYCDIWLSSSDLMRYANQLRERNASTVDTGTHKDDN